MKTFLSLLLLIVAPLSSYGQLGDPSFVASLGERNQWLIQVTTTTTPQTFSFYSIGSANGLSVRWGDGASDSYSNAGGQVNSHSYVTPGSYVVAFSGTASRISFRSADGGTPLLVTRLLGPANVGGITSFQNTFYGCTGITGSIPADLFRYNTLVSSSGFQSTFQGCTGLTGSIPADLFRYNTMVFHMDSETHFTVAQDLLITFLPICSDITHLFQAYGFQFTFFNCTGLTGNIPADLFRYNTLVSTYGFHSTFRGCTGFNWKYTC